MIPPGRTAALSQTHDDRSREIVLLAGFANADIGYHLGHAISNPIRSCHDRGRSTELRSRTNRPAGECYHRRETSCGACLANS